MFQDEAGFGRINKPKQCWRRKGVRPSVPCHHIREYRQRFHMTISFLCVMAQHGTNQKLWNDFQILNLFSYLHIIQKLIRLNKSGKNCVQEDFTMRYFKRSQRQSIDFAQLFAISHLIPFAALLHAIGLLNVLIKDQYHFSFFSLTVVIRLCDRSPAPDITGKLYSASIARGKKPAFETRKKPDRIRLFRKYIFFSSLRNSCGVLFVRLVAAANKRSDLVRIVKLSQIELDRSCVNDRDLAVAVNIRSLEPISCER